MSALGYTTYNSTLLQGCSFDDGIKQNDANIQYFFAAKNYNVSGCKGIYTNSLHPYEEKNWNNYFLLNFKSFIVRCS